MPKATGLCRRIDDLGRVVIPKEIRRFMHINEGDVFEIYTDGKDSVIFRKYDVSCEYKADIDSIINSISEDVTLGNSESYKDVLVLLQQARDKL